MIKEHYSTPDAVIICDLRKEILNLKMELGNTKRELNQFTEAWLKSWNQRLDDFKREQKAVIDEWKAGKR